MEALVRSYEKKNVFFIHTLGGDEELPVLHFKKHYRLNYPVIPDNIDRHRHLIRVTGITNVAVFGGDGVCVLNESFMDGGSGSGFQKAIDAALAKLDGPNRREEAYIDGGTVYAPPVKDDGPIVRRRSPFLAAGPSGEVHLVYSSEEGGTGDVLMRSFEGGKWGKDVPVAATKADEYAPTAASVGKGQVLVAFVSNEKGLYDIHAAVVKDGKVQKRQQITKSRNDAMAPALGGGGKVEPWLAWYEWSRMGDLSRDREVFAAAYKRGAWSRPIQVSPREVPTYEDHADPSIAPDGKGGAWVSWAWDYHGTLPQKPPVDENSIFVRRVDGSMKLGEILAAGFRGTGRARDYSPSIAVAQDGVPWVAWDNSHKSSLGYNAKALFVNRLVGKDFPEQVEAAASRGAVDSPRLLTDSKGGLHLLWNQESGGAWEVWIKPVGPKGMGEARRLDLKAKNPRYPAGCFDTSGKLWIAYTDVVRPKWDVRAESVEG